MLKSAGGGSRLAGSSLFLSHFHSLVCGFIFSNLFCYLLLVPLRWAGLCRTRRLVLYSCHGTKVALERDGRGRRGFMGWSRWLSEASFLQLADGGFGLVLGGQRRLRHQAY